MTNLLDEIEPGVTWCEGEHPRADDKWNTRKEHAMHFHCEVWIPDGVDPAETVALFMKPHEERYVKAEDGEDGDDDGEVRLGFWDWFQIGGRWKGAHVDGYKASDDPAHKERCMVCGGIGRRPDADDLERLNPGWIEGTNGCNGCKGTGIADSWPSAWQPHVGDVMSLDQVPAAFDCYTLVLGEEVYHKEVWDPKMDNPSHPEWPGGFKDTEFDGKVRAFLEAKGVSDGRLVTVDYHS